MKKGIRITAIVVSVLYSLGVMSNIEGSLNFIARLTNIKIEKMIELLQISYKLISISFPLLIGFCLYKIYDLIEKNKALKKFYDYELNRQGNHFRSSFIQVDKQIKFIYDKIGVKPIKEDINENDKNNDAAIQKLFYEMVNEYNHSFKDWNMKDIYVE